MTESITIATCLRRALELQNVSESARLDIELLLAHILKKNRVYLFTWPEKILTPEQAAAFDIFFQRRLSGEPIAHIIGQREFWSLPLAVDNTTLIPRPDTELLVETALELFAQDSSTKIRKLLDLGTGSGAIVLAMASEKPHWQCVGVDKYSAAVALAEKNCTHLQLTNVEIRQSDWFSAVGEQGFDVIVSNPPYIDPDDPHLQQGDVRFEPLTALIAANNGMADIEQIAQQALQYLLPAGWLLIEHGYNQGKAARELFIRCGYQNVATLRDMSGNERVTLGQRDAV